MSLLDPDFLSTLQAFAPQVAPSPSTLSAIAPQQDSQPSSSFDLGGALQRVAAATNGSESLQKYDTGQIALNREQAVNSTLAQLAKQGVTSPQQILGKLATVDPQYAEKAASLQAANPLASLFQGSSAPGVDTGTADSSGTPTGDSFIASLPPQIGSQVKAIADGRLQPPGGMALKTPYWQQMMQLVGQYDPSFDMVNYNARAATRKDFTSGKSAQNITAMNTALGHLDSLNTDFQGLDNGSVPTWNKVANAIGVATGNDKLQTASTNVNTDANAVASEMAKVFRSTGMSESDIDEWKKQISTSASPAQQKAVVNKAIDLLGSRLDSLGQQYNQGMGTTKEGIELLSPKAQEAYKRITGDTPAKTAASGNLAVDNAKTIPARVTTESDIAAAAQKTGKSVQQVKADAIAKGYKIQ